MEESMFPNQQTAEARYIAIFGTRTRFVVMVLVLLCLTSIWSNILTFQFSVICMSPKDDINMTFINGTAEKDTFTFTSNEKSWAITAVAIAALVGNFPIVQLVNRIGIRTIFTALGILSACATLLMPVAIRLGYGYLLVARICQGIAFAANFPVIGAFCAKWAYYKQNGLFVSALVAYVQLSPAITMPVSGSLCEAFRWPSVFYAHGAVTLVLFLVYGIFYRNSPNKHPFVGNVELNKISIGKAQVVDKRAAQKVPYLDILKTPAVWAVWVASLGNFVCVNMMFLFSPIYLSTVLGFPVHKTGISAALPPLAQFLAKLICGAVSDRIKFISEVNKFRFFNTLAFLGCGLGLTILGFMGTEHKNVNMLMLGASAGVLGATTGGFFKSGPVISRQYSHFVTGNISLGITITMVVIPFIVNSLTPNNTQEEWRWVFWLVAAFMLVANIFFCIFIRGEPCEFTRDDYVVKKPAVTDSSRSEPVQQQF
ncbi:unnamed protein product [Auanema sp. JU1783]|nr:unnamed protein product [Auanema sp. JU1783]